MLTATAPRSRTRTSPPRAMHLRLTPLREGHGVEPIVLPAGTARIGTGEPCEVAIPLRGVAELHCTITHQNNEYRLTANHPLTWLNDGPVRQSRLKAGDILTLGPLELRVDFVAVEEPEPELETPIAVAPTPEPAPAPRPIVVETPANPESTSPAWTATAPAAAPVASPAPAPSRPPCAEPLPPSAVPFDVLSASTTNTLRSPVGRAWKRLTATEQAATSWELLDEAQAARNLRQDLERLEREIATHRAKAVAPPNQPALDSAVVEAWEARGREREQALAAQSHALTEQQSAVARRHEELLRERQKLEEGLRDLASRRAAFDTEQAGLGDVMQSVRREREELRKLREEQAAKIHGLQARLDERLADLRDSEKQLESDRADLEACLAEHDRRAAELAAAEAALETRAAELQATTLSFRASQENRESDRQTELEDVRREARRLAAERDELQQQVDRSNEEHTRLGGAWDQLRAEQDRLAEDRRALEQSQADLDDERNRLDDEQASLAAEHERLTALEARLVDDRAALTREREEVASAQAALVTDRNHFTEREQQLAAETARLASLQQRLDDELQAAADERRRLGASDDQRSFELRTELNELRESHRTLRESHDAQSTECDALRLREQQLQQQIDQLISDRADRDREWERLQEEQETAAADYQSLDALKNELATERERLSAREARLAADQQRVAALEARLNEEIATLSHQQEELAGSLTGFDTERERILAAEEELAAERERLANLERQLANEQQAVSRERDRLDRIEEEQVAERDSRAAVEHDLAEERQRLADLEHKIEAEHQRLHDVQNQLSAERQVLQEELDRLHSTRVDERTAPLHEQLALLEQTAPADYRELPSDALDVDSLNALPDAVVQPSPPAIAAPVEQSEQASEPEPGVEAPRTRERIEYGASRNQLPSMMPASYLEFLEELHASSETSAAPAEATQESLAESSLSSSPEAAHAASTTTQAAAGGAEESHTLRSQLAALFGISQTQLDRAAERDGDEVLPAAEPVAESIPPAEAVPEPHALAHAPASTHAAAVVHAGEHSADDPIAAYMTQLLARNNRTGEPATPPWKPAEPAREAAPSPAPTITDDEAAPPVEAPTPTPAPRARKKLDASEKEELRANLDSMRQLANFSARSAVAEHHSKKLGTSFQVKLTMTILCGVVTAILLTSELWSANSYRLQGLGTLLVTMVAGFELARTMRTLQRVNRSATPPELPQDDDSSAPQSTNSEATASS